MAIVNIPSNLLTYAQSDYCEIKTIVKSMKSLADFQSDYCEIKIYIPLEKAKTETNKTIITIFLAWIPKGPKNENLGMSPIFEPNKISV